MKKLILTEEEFNNLEPFHIVEGTIEKESKMYYHPDNEKEIIKVYNDFDNKLYMMEKIRTTRNLIRYIKDTNIKELLQPSGIIILNNQIIGTILSEIEAYTARLYLHTNIINIKIKIEILRQIGILLEKIKSTYPKYNAAFSDVHTDNFLVDDITVDKNRNITNLSIVACDTDSMRILDSKGNPAYYLCDSEKLSEFDKYQLDTEHIIIPDSNTDIYCYIMIILDFISRSNYVYCLNDSEYNRYLDYLDSINVNPDLLKAFASVYDDTTDNITPLPYLDSLNEIDENASLQSFYKSKTLTF